MHAGKKATVTFDAVIQHAVRRGQLQLRYVPQPRLTPDDLTVVVSGAAWTFDGPTTFHATMDRTLTPTWAVRRA